MAFSFFYLHGVCVCFPRYGADKLYLVRLAKVTPVSDFAVYCGLRLIYSLL